MSTYSSVTRSLEPADGRVLMAYDCATLEEPDVRCMVVAATWHGDRLMAAIVKPNGVFRVVDAATLRFRDREETE